MATTVFISGSVPTVGHELRERVDDLFESSTQAYREALLGCLVAKILDPATDVRLPYVGLGPQAFSGRTLDERVINPFLRDNEIPCSQGPYLAVFRRSIRFHEETREGLRDKRRYDSFLAILQAMEESDQQTLDSLLRYILFRFLGLREESRISVARLGRISLEQYGTLLTGLLAAVSGGRFPLFIAVAMFSTINECFDLQWIIEWQGINVADAASGSQGDITIRRRNGETILAVEVTDRRVDESRVAATFRTKIAPAGIRDYLFLLGMGGATEAAREEARRYFAQGHDVNFLPIQDWVLMLLGTMGQPGRDLFNKHLIRLLDATDVPKAVKVIWNQHVMSLIGSSGTSQ